MDILIVFKVAEELIGVDIRKVREVTELPAVVKVPRASDFIVGLSNIRGDVLPVLSLRRRFGISGDEVCNLLLVVEDGERLAGLRVDSLIGTKKVDMRLVNKNSEFLSSRKGNKFFIGVYETEEKPILILDLQKVLTND